MDDVIAKAVQVLLAAGWKGVLVAVLIALAYAALRVYAPRIELGPGSPQQVADENGPQPPGQPQPTDPNRPDMDQGGG